MPDGVGRRVIMVGLFPPPVHGMAVINQHLLGVFRAAGATVEVVDVSAEIASRDWRDRVWRVGAALRGLIGFWRMTTGRRGRCTVYLSVSGGMGQLYDLLFVLMARLRRLRLFLHHHNYRYLDGRRAVTSRLFALAGSTAVHVALCNHQLAALEDQYHAVGRGLVVSNAALVEAGGNAVAPRSGTLRTIAFFSNISVEKGIGEFLALLDRLTERGLEVKALIGGPFVERRARQMVGPYAEERRVEVVGPLYDAAKEAFFDRIDALIFPSHMESEPLVVYEALRAAVPVIALRRGCLGGMLDGGGGVLIEDRRRFAVEAAERVAVWHAHPDAWRRAAMDARRRFDELRSAALPATGRLVDEVLRAE